MKKIIVLLVMYNLVYAGDLDRVGTTTLWVTQGYVFESISGTGFGRSIYSNVANLGSTNPAAIYDVDNISMGISYQFESAIKQAWFVDLNHERGHLYLPQSLGIIYPLKSFRIGIGFSQRYNSFFSTDEYESTSEFQPEGTGEFFTADRNSLIICYSGLFSYTNNNIIRTNDELCLGIQLNYNVLYLTDRIYHTQAKVQGGAFSAALGLRYKFGDNLQIGLFYERNPSFNEKIKVESDIIVGPDTNTAVAGNNPDIRAIIDTNYYLKDKLPDKLNLGLLYRFNESLEMTLEVCDIYWHQLSEESLNSFDISGSLLGHLTENLSISAGLLSTERRYDKQSDYYSTINDNLDGLFMLAGVNLRYGAFDFDLALVTAVVYGEWRKQNIGKFSLGYSM